jgi:hypothetical protein
MQRDSSVPNKKNPIITRFPIATGVPIFVNMEAEYITTPAFPFDSTVKRVATAIHAAFLYLASQKVCFQLKSVVTSSFSVSFFVSLISLILFSI